MRASGQLGTVPKELSRWLYFALLMAVLSAWALYFQGAPRKHPAPRPSPSEGATAEIPRPPTATTGTAGTAPPSLRPPAPTAQAPDAGETGLRDDDPSPDVNMRGLTVAQARQRQAIIDRARERNAANARRWERNSAAWEHETRDPQWAEPHEEDLRMILVDAKVDHLLVNVECRRTMCRVQAETLDSHSFILLSKVPGLFEALGGDEAAMDAVGPPADRILTILSPPGLR